MAFYNPFLSQVMKHIRQERPKLNKNTNFYNRVERSRGGNYVEVWFLTEGCTWDAKGGCTMCNYGCGEYRTEKEIVDAVRDGINAISVDVQELVVSPSGSMLDTQEVPDNARREIFRLIRRFPTNQFVFETRPDTITNDVVNEYVESIPDKKLGIEMGLESSNPWIQKYCINKGSHPQEFLAAAKIIKNYNVDVIANISLGTAFLTPKEAVDDAVSSVEWALSNFADIAVVFPLHVKPYSLLAWLLHNGLYHPPSLWSLVEVLKCVDPIILDRIEISWYRSYYADPSKLIASPTTCKLCIDEVMCWLDEYRDKRSLHAVNRLNEISCHCKEKWRSDFNVGTVLQLPERVEKVYKRLKDDYKLHKWWDIHGAELTRELLEEFPIVENMEKR